MYYNLFTTDILTLLRPLLYNKYTFISTYKHLLKEYHGVTINTSRVPPL